MIVVTMMTVLIMRTKTMHIMMLLRRSSAQVDRIIDAVGVENIRENVVMDKMQVRSPIFNNYLAKLLAQIRKVLPRNKT